MCDRKKCVWWLQRTSNFAISLEVAGCVYGCEFNKTGDRLWGTLICHIHEGVDVF